MHSKPSQVGLVSIEVYFLEMIIMARVLNCKEYVR